MSYPTPLAWSPLRNARPDPERRALIRVGQDYFCSLEQISVNQLPARLTSAQLLCIQLPLAAPDRQPWTRTAQERLETHPKAFDDFDPVLQPGCGITAYGTAPSCRTRDSARHSAQFFARSRPKLQEWLHQVHKAVASSSPIDISPVTRYHASRDTK